jgi:glycerophosphoryl diester phosphodiesterase
MFQIVAHRGVTAAAPENTMAAFARALELGIDAVELDVRLTRDHRPVVYHDFYLDDLTTASGPIFARTAADLDRVRVIDRDRSRSHRIPLLEEVLDQFAGRLGLEIELKGPEPEAATAVGKVLARYRSSWERMEVTSFEPALLTGLRAECGGIASALLFPRSEPWMRPDVVAYAALQRARLAGADAVHLDPGQLSDVSVASIRAAGIEVHAHSVNDVASLDLAATLALPWICSDEPERAMQFRRERATS